MVDRQRLRELAEACEASSAHGPWEWTGGYPQRITNGAAALIAETFENPDMPPVLVEYLAACDPQTILALVGGGDG
jgi:hypothetical protein